MPRHLENPFDDFLMMLIDPFLKPLRNAGVTPNMITHCSIATAALSLLCCLHGRAVWAAILWLTNYVADVADGMMARRYKMESAFGSFLDHFSDVAAFLGLMAFVIWRLIQNPLLPKWPLIIECMLLCCAWYHLQCQEKDSRHYPFDGVDGSRCKDKRYLKYTRWLGVGTLTMWHVCLILTYT